ncbi:hypothetical protein J2M53_12890 [Arthrobacter sp. zg-ZUI100]|uniref:hypothetical protein n=1 Tax=Arthrobacter jiangjiafuii TaxID=2817475 RepID=UPI001AEF29EC|nr:hypothetical protein [Arthrobacter jiangjiafuii]MBP3037140.1 hypothetical protein [Arthrobacter jiangjiafuii]
MSEKQLGAAPGEESDPAVAGKSGGWFGRLRAQPGFRTASIAFVLTVVLGIGSTAAYAYWSQSNTVTQMVTLQRQALPVITGNASCRLGPKLQYHVYYSAVAPASLPSGASILATVTIPGKDELKYVVPNTGSFSLRELPDLVSKLGWTFGGTNFSVSVTSAYINSPAATTPPYAVQVADIGVAPAPPQPGKAAEAYWNNLTFVC